MSTGFAGYGSSASRDDEVRLTRRIWFLERGTPGLAMGLATSITDIGHYASSPTLPPPSQPLQDFVQQDRRERLACPE